MAQQAAFASASAHMQEAGACRIHVWLWLFWGGLCWSPKTDQEALLQAVNAAAVNVAAANAAAANAAAANAAAANAAAANAVAASAVAANVMAANPAAAHPVAANPLAATAAAANVAATSSAASAATNIVLAPVRAEAKIPGSELGDTRDLSESL